MALSKKRQIILGTASIITTTAFWTTIYFVAKNRFGNEYEDQFYNKSGVFSTVPKTNPVLFNKENPTESFKELRKDNLIRIENSYLIFDLYPLTGVENFDSDFFATLMEYTQNNVERSIKKDSQGWTRRGEKISMALRLPSSAKTVSRFEAYKFINLNLSNVEEVLSDSFSGKEIEFLTITKVEKIGDSAFSNTNLKSLSLPKTIKEIGKNAFRKNELSEVTFPDGLKLIDSGAFKENKIFKVYVKETTATPDPFDSGVAIEIKND